MKPIFLYSGRGMLAATRESTSARLTVGATTQTGGTLLARSANLFRGSVRKRSGRPPPNQTGRSSMDRLRRGAGLGRQQGRDILRENGDRIPAAPFVEKSRGGMLV